MAPRVPRYKDEEGLYLKVFEAQFKYFIAWYIPDDDDIGGYLTNTRSPTGDEVMDLAIEVCREFFVARKWPLPKPSATFFFESQKQARECLREINARLMARNHPKQD